MKKKVFIFLFLVGLFLYGIVLSSQVFADVSPTPEPCLKSSTNPGSWCPLVTGATYTCAADYNAWTADKSQNLWVNDEEITALGKAGERSRQFLYWSLTHRSIDNHPVILSVWSFAKNLTYFFLLIVAAIFGLGIIIGQRANFNLKIEVWPLIIKIGLLFLYVTFSATIVLLIIQLSDTLMLFFIEKLGVKDLFNIFFVSGSGGSVIKDSETAYQTFQGCSNINVGLLDSVKTSKFMINITNMTYYLIGIMLILRKIILWLLLFVSPFLALLMPFVLIRNIGWIWIGVFFQWVFYGPLFALFLGGLAQIWNSPSHIPFNFDFSRAGNLQGFIYPTSINILYGGPAQTLGLLNSSNYADTFAEYIIALIMLWAVTFFPWWLLRIFRDYCCDGIYAMKNILLSMYDQTRGGPSPQPPAPAPTPTATGTAIKMPKEVEIPIKVRLETVEQIKRAETNEITRSLNLSVSRLTDIARFETDKQTKETVNKNLNYLQNPTRAETPTERQKYMNIRSELFSRAIKEDQHAKQVLSSISTSKIEQLQRRDEFLKSIPQTVPVTHIVSIKVKMPQSKVQSITSNYLHSASNNTSIINEVAEKAHFSQSQITSVITSLIGNIDKSTQDIIPKIIQETGLEKKSVVIIIQIFSKAIKENKQIAEEVAKSENMDVEEVEKIVINQLPIIAEPEKHIEETISIPPTVSLEDYEQVKKMWKAQYDKGEVPVSEEIKSRQDWVNKDILFITNTVNKLLSSSNELRQEGLDSLGYILPIFLINNLKGDEMMVYLKAKLEAAKEVKEEIEKEKIIAQQVEVKKEEFVEVARPKEETKEKEMKMENESKPEAQNPKSEINSNDQNSNEKKV